MKRLFGLVVMLLLVGSLFAVPKTAYLIFYPYENTREEIILLLDTLQKGTGLNTKAYQNGDGIYWVEIEVSQFDLDDYLQIVVIDELDRFTTKLVGVESKYIQKDFHYLIYKLEMSASELSLRFESSKFRLL